MEGKKEKKRRDKLTAQSHAHLFFVIRWNPPTPFRVVILYEFLRESSLHTYITLSVHHTSSHLHACQERTFLDIEQVVRCIPVYLRPTSRRISI